MTIKTTLKRALGLAAGGGLLVGSMVMSAPAEAGGSTMTFASAAPRAECDAELQAKADLTLARGESIYEIVPCRYHYSDDVFVGWYSSA
ncbi:hypothetical protein [Parenemella sanctibonifatiensis]|uniref:Uncharacterized protein n=1 Tax=Parenemella sanctibonifatiensis TaxID=2016505 RepID=A0A255EGP6_9ACTN|nr:hypothetical protein [Parenemella sanctibonifatiensis]OYN88775.1 hypothetical protein CGZ92_03450 [Parenemella sanctibonifatiensis]